MDWMAETSERLRRHNQILFSQDSPLLAPLLLLLERQDRRTVVLWALELAEESAAVLSQRYPHEDRPQAAVDASRSWAAGLIKMPFAKRAILQCHALAKELSSQEDIALCHAVGQACSTVHTPGHALGYPIYELTAIVRRLGLDHCREAVETRAEDYCRRLLYWEAHWREAPGPWASFLTKPSRETHLV